MIKAKMSTWRAFMTVVLAILFLVPGALPMVNGDGSAHSRVGDFTIDAIPSQLLETGQGGNLWWLIEITSMNGFNSEVTLSVSGLPANSNHWFYPDKVTPAANGKVSAFLRFNTTATTPTGPVDVQISGTSAPLGHSVLKHARVRSGPYITTEAVPFEQSAAPGETVDYSLKLIACNGFAASTSIFNPWDGSLSASYVFVPASPVNVPKDSIVIVKMSVTVPGNAALGMYNIILSGMTNPYFINWSAGVRLRVVDKNGLGVSGRPWMQSVAQGDSATFTFEVRSHGTFSAKTDMSIGQPLPADITTSFSPSSVTPVAGGSNLTTLTITTSGSTAAGIYPITGKATAGQMTDRDIVYLWVTDTPDFGLRGTPSSQYVVPTGKVSYTVVLTSLNNFTGDVNLGIQSPPDKSTVTLASKKVTLDKEDVVNVGLDVTAGATTPTGRYAIRVVASNDTLMHYIDLELVVTNVLPSDFNLTSHDASRTAVDQPCIYHVSMSSQSGYNGNAAMTVEGVPKGTSATFEKDTVYIGSGTTVWSNLTVIPTASTPSGEYVLRIVGLNATGKLRHEAEVLFRLLPHPGVIVTAIPNEVGVLQGAWTDLTVQVNGTYGFVGSVDFSQVTLLAGFSATFSKTTVVADGYTVMNLSVAPTVATGQHDISFFAKNATAQFPCGLQVNVQNYSLSTGTGASILIGTNGKATVKGTGDAGFTGLVGLSVENVPNGVTMTPPANIMIPGSADITITVSNKAVSGSYPVKVIGSYSGNTRTCILTLNLTNFTIVASPSELSLLPGGKATVRVDVISVLGFMGTVQLTMIAPQSIATSLSEISVLPPGHTTLTITVPRTTALGKYVITVNGTYSTQVRGTDIILNVHGFKVPVDPDLIKAARGTQVNYRVNITSELGYFGLVNLSVEGLPSGVTAGFGAKRLNTSNSTGLVVQVGINAVPGTYTLTINGTSGTYTVKTQVHLRVMDIWLVSDPTMVTVVAGQNATYKVSLDGKLDASDEVRVSVIAPLNADVSSPDFVLKQGTSKTLVVGTKDLPAGDYNITLRPDIGSPLVVVVVVQDFGLAGTSLTVIQGGKAISTVKVTSIHGFAGQVDLVVDQVPQGIKATLKPTQVTAGSSASLTVEVAATYPTGLLSLYLRSTAPAVRTAEVKVQVNSGAPNYDMKVTPANLQVRRGESGKYKIELTMVTGSKTTVNLELPVLPPGITAEWTTMSGVDVPATKYIQITVDKNADLGKFNLTFVAKNGSFEVKRTVTLEVTKAKPRGFLGADNSYLLGAMALFVILIIAAIIAAAYMMSRKRKAEPKLEMVQPGPGPHAGRDVGEDLQYGRKTRATPKEMARPETEYTYVPETAEEPAPVEVMEEPEQAPVEEAPLAVEPEPVVPVKPEPEVPKKAPEAPKKVEAPARPKKPEVKKSSDVNIDEILKKLKET